jgi:hypothetical protein
MQAIMPFAERQRARRWTIGLRLKVLARFKNQFDGYIPT